MTSAWTIGCTTRHLKSASEPDGKRRTSLPAERDIAQRLCLDGSQKRLKRPLPGSDKKCMNELPPEDQPDVFRVGPVGPIPDPLRGRPSVRR
jgi:hypothetical protein